MGFDQKVTLVTGASRGIGAAIAEELGKEGAIIIGTATSESGAEKISARFAEIGIQGQGMVLNVTDPESVECLLKAIKGAYGTPAILINNAGITKDNLLMRMSEEEWFEGINTNLSSVYRLSKACLRGMMKARWGRIITVGSVVGSMGNAGQSNYAASKAGIIGFSKSVALELGSRNIRCNVVAPGFIETEMTANLDDAVVNEWRKGIPLKRGGTPLDIANTCVWLASDLSSYVTGQVINVDGGMLT
jgi:3-oxoacyl-[acyl-carrier protein] reductase